MIPQYLRFFMPSSVHRQYLNRKGAHIARSAKIGPFALVGTTRLTMGDGSAIKPFSRIRATEVSIGEGAFIESMTSIVLNRLELGAKSSVARLTVVSGQPSLERSSLEVGDHSRIFPLCWIDAGHGVRLGSRVGIGGHGLIFTHGSWANYFRGAPVDSGPVTIQDGTWLPWRVFIMPRVNIGTDCIIGAGSVVTKSIPNGALAAGSPAKVLRERAYDELTDDQLQDRVRTMLTKYNAEVPEAKVVRFAGADALSAGARRCDYLLTADVEPQQARAVAALGTPVIDLTRERAYLTPSGYGGDIVSWLTSFGVRCDVERVQPLETRD